MNCPDRITAEAEAAYGGFCPTLPDPIAALRASDLLRSNAAMVRARCEGQRDRLRAAIAQCSDYYARNHCRQYLAKVEAVLRQPSLGIASFDGVTGANGWAAGIDDAIRSALWRPKTA